MLDFSMDTGTRRNRRRVTQPSDSGLNPESTTLITPGLQSTRLEQLRIQPFSSKYQNATTFETNVFSIFQKLPSSSSKARAKWSRNQHSPSGLCRSNAISRSNDTNSTNYTVFSREEDLNMVCVIKLAKVKTSCKKM